MVESMVDRSLLQTYSVLPGDTGAGERYRRSGFGSPTDVSVLVAAFESVAKQPLR